MKSIEIPQNVRLGVPRIEDLFGAYAIHEPAMRSLHSYLESTGIKQHIANANARQATDQKNTTPAFTMIEGSGIAVVPIVGVMTKSGTSLSPFPGTTATRSTIRGLARADDVSAILVNIDSPGGSTKGVSDLANDIASAAKIKPVVAMIEDLGASAGYWVASQASIIVANPSAIVGSIGTYLVVEDSSEGAAQHGIKVHVLSTGFFKGAAEDGTVVTDAHLAEFQRFTDSLQELFTKAVMDGRGLDRKTVESLSTGAVWIGSHAKNMGLVDRIGDFDLALSLTEELIAHRQRRPSSVAGFGTEEMPSAGFSLPDAGMSCGGKTGKVTEMQSDMQRVDLISLKKALPNASAEFREQAVIDGLTVAEAQTRYMGALESGAIQGGGPGVPSALMPMASGGGGNARGGAADSFDGAIRELTARGMDRSKAVAKVSKECPELHRAYLLETNSGHVSRLVDSKFGV